MTTELTGIVIVAVLAAGLILWYKYGSTQDKTAPANDSTLINVGYSIAAIGGLKSSGTINITGNTYPYPLNVPATLPFEGSFAEVRGKQIQVTYNTTDPAPIRMTIFVGNKLLVSKDFITPGSTSVSAVIP